MLATINPLITPNNPPSVSFSSIGGYQVPPYSGSSFATIDLLLPTQLTDPIPIVVKSVNIPVGSPVTISYSGPGTPTFTSAPLSGTITASSATVYASNLSRTGVTYLFVLATFDPTLIAVGLRQDGPDAVAKVELSALPGQITTFRFLRGDGSEIPQSRLSRELLQALGL